MSATLRMLEKASTSLARSDAKVKAAHSKGVVWSHTRIPVSRLAPVEADPGSGAVFYYLPGGNSYCLLLPLKGSEPVWAGSLTALRKAHLEKVKGLRIPGRGLRVATQDRFHGEDGKSKYVWQFGTLLDVEHPSVIRFSRYHHELRARIQITPKHPGAIGPIIEVPLRDILICDSPALIKKLEAARKLEEKAEAKVKALEALLPSFYTARRMEAKTRKTRTDGEDLPPIDSVLFTRLSVQQVRRRR